MAVNTFGVTASMCAARVGWLTLSTSSVPTTSEVETWITQAAAKVNDLLKAFGVDVDGLTSTSNPSLFYSMQGEVAAKVEAQIRSTNRGEDGDLVDRLIAGWNGFIGGLKNRPDLVTGDADSVTAKSNVTSSTRATRTPFWRRGMDL